MKMETVAEGYERYITDVPTADRRHAFYAGVWFLMTLVFRDRDGDGVLDTVSMTEDCMAVFEAYVEYDDKDKQS